MNATRWLCRPPPWTTFRGWSWHKTTPAFHVTLLHSNSTMISQWQRHLLEKVDPWNACRTPIYSRKLSLQLNNYECSNSSTSHSAIPQHLQPWLSDPHIKTSKDGWQNIQQIASLLIITCSTFWRKFASSTNIRTTLQHSLHKFIGHGSRGKPFAPWVYSNIHSWLIYLFTSNPFSQFS